MELPTSVTVSLIVVLSVGLLGFGVGSAVADTQEAEPNDDFDSAQEIPEGNVTGEIVDGESDFYRIEANTTDAFDVAIPERNGDIGIRLYDSQRNSLASDDFGGARGATLKAPQTGTYYVEIFGDGANVNGNYTASIEKITPSENDQFAPNDGFESAVTVEEGFSNGTIWGGESDYFKIDANETDALDLAIPQRNADIDLVLYDPDRNQLANDNFGNNRQITLKAPETGTYYIEVAGSDTQTTGDYTLSVEKVTPAENDAFAPNDDFGTAATVEEGFTEAKLWGGESDYFKIEANTTEALDIEITENEGDITPVLYGPDREQLATSGFQSRRITRKAPQQGTYYIEVSGDGKQFTGNYTLRVDTVTPAENDQFAPNDDFDTAATVEEGFTEATIWGGESDYFAIDANTTDALDVEISQRETDLNLVLYGPNRERLEANRFGAREITRKAPETGTYYIEVVGANDQSTGDYTLSVEKVTPAENDAFAPNDDFESAAVLTQQFTDAQIWGGESDFYRVGLNAGETIDLGFSERNGDVDLRLYDPNRTEVASSTFGTRALTHQAVATGAYFVEVEGTDRQTTGEYTLQSNRTGVPPGIGTLDVSLSRSTVATNQSTAVDVTVTDAESDNPVTGATVAASTLGVSERTTDSTGTATLTVNESDTGDYPVSVSADGYGNATATLSVQEPPILGPLSIEAGTLDPSTVDENQTVTHDLTFTVDNLSADGDTDTVNVTFPSEATSVSDNDVSVFDATNSEIQISSSASVIDVNGDSVAEVLTVAVAPDEAFDTSTVTVEISVDVGFPDISGNTTLGIDASVSDSDGDSAGPTEVASVTVVDTGVDRPDAPAVVGDSQAKDLDGNGAYEDVNGDDTFNIVDVNALFQNRQGSVVQDNPGLFDFNGDGSVNIVDVNALFQNSQN